jgi:hypothetical protein
MADTAVAWAEKMSGVLGDAVKRVKKAFDDSPSSGETNGAPKGGAAPSGNGAPSGSAAPGGTAKPRDNGTPTGDNAAPASGGAPTAATPNGAGAPPAGAPVANGKGDAAPAAAKPGPAAGGTTAKDHAEAAKKALESVNAILTQAKAAEGEFKKFTTDAQAGKKQADDARRQAEAAEKSIPPAAPVPAPQGKDPKAQYDSALKITGNVAKVQSDAEAKVDTVRMQGGAVTEANANLEVIHQAAAKNVEKLTTLGETAGDAAESANAAAKSAATAAAESKKKADQAAKDKAADKDAHMKAAQEDAQHAAAAKDAGAKAEAARKQVIAIIKSAATQSQAVEKQSQETKAAAEALKQKNDAVVQKLAPHYQAVGKAEQQEAECKAKLSAEDAESVLQRRYEELGGDPELRKLLDDEDKAFVTLTEKHRAELQKWQLDQAKQLGDYKTRLETTLKDGEAFLAPSKEFIERERPHAEKAQSDADALGEKLKTEPGKELAHEIAERTHRIEEIEHKVEFNQKLVEKTQAAMEDLTKQFEYIDAQYEASEKVIADSRTELDNFCEMQSMSLETKVDYLQTRPKPVRDRIQKTLSAERDRVVRLNVLNIQSKQIEFEPQTEPVKRDPIDWKPVQERIGKLQAASLEDLKKDDPKLAELQAEYDKAGGDPALLEKRVARWKQDVAKALEGDKERGAEYEARSEKLRKHLAELERQMQESETNYKGYSESLKYKQQLFDDLEKKIQDQNSFEALTPQEKATYFLLEKEIERLKVQVANYDRQSVADKFARTNAEKLLETERVRHEQIVDDDRHVLPQPTSDDIHALPLRVKYTELTGKQAPS